MQHIPMRDGAGAPARVSQVQQAAPFDSSGGRRRESRAASAAGRSACANIQVAHEAATHAAAKQRTVQHGGGGVVQNETRCVLWWCARAASRQLERRRVQVCVPRAVGGPRRHGARARRVLRPYHSKYATPRENHHTIRRPYGRYMHIQREIAGFRRSLRGTCARVGDGRTDRQTPNNGLRTWRSPPPYRLRTTPGKLTSNGAVHLHEYEYVSTRLWCECAW
jgi:hypothetical protein